MIVDERLVTYINSLDTGNTAMLDQIEREATADYVPIAELFEVSACHEEAGTYFRSWDCGGIFRHPYGGVRSCAVSDYNDREL